MDKVRHEDVLSSKENAESEGDGSNNIETLVTDG